MPIGNGVFPFFSFSEKALNITEPSPPKNCNIKLKILPLPPRSQNCAENDPNIDYGKKILHRNIRLPDERSR